ncbi:Uncharacterised protein [Salmonella enterica]|nr:Uncharacterised protein [Salmonella enterica]
MQDLPALIRRFFAPVASPVSHRYTCNRQQPHTARAEPAGHPNNIVKYTRPGRVPGLTSSVQSLAAPVIKNSLRVIFIRPAPRLSPECRSPETVSAIHAISAGNPSAIPTAGHSPFHVISFVVTSPPSTPHPSDPRPGPLFTSVYPPAPHPVPEQTHRTALMPATPCASASLSRVATGRSYRQRM